MPKTLTRIRWFLQTEAFAGNEQDLMPYKGFSITLWLDCHLSNRRIPQFTPGGLTVSDGTRLWSCALPYSFQSLTTDEIRELACEFIDSKLTP